MEIKYTKDGVIFNNEFISLAEIIKNVNAVEINDDKLAMMTMTWGYSRNFDGVCETIVLPINRLNNIKEIISGKMIYFGEINGKHSDIHGVLEENEIKISTNKNEINKFLTTNPSGHNYDHSFLDTFYNYLLDGQYDISDEDIKKFKINYCGMD